MEALGAHYADPERVGMTAANLKAAYVVVDAQCLVLMSATLEVRG